MARRVNKKPIQQQKTAKRVQARRGRVVQKTTVKQPSKKVLGIKKKSAPKKEPAKSLKTRGKQVKTKKKTNSLAMMPVIKKAGLEIKQKLTLWPSELVAKWQSWRWQEKWETKKKDLVKKKKKFARARKKWWLRQQAALTAQKETVVEFQKEQKKNWRRAWRRQKRNWLKKQTQFKQNVLTKWQAYLVERARRQAKREKAHQLKKVAWEAKRAAREAEKTARLKKKAALKDLRDKAKKASQQKKKSKKTKEIPVADPRVLVLGSERGWGWWLAMSILMTITLVLLAILWYLSQIILPDLPDVKDLAHLEQHATTKIYDRDHRLLYNIYEEENRTPIALSEMGEWIVKATVSIEDQNFWSHNGFSIQGMIRAARNNYQTGRVQGGSTITQQLVKNRLLTREKTMERKVKELILSILVEGTYTKEQILEMYLNDVNYGGTIYGVEQAAVTYFGKNAKNLTLGEAAYLAGVVTAPSVYMPYGGRMEAALERRNEVLRRMVEDGYISLEMANEVAGQELHFLARTTQIKAPHFVMYIKQWLENEYGVAAVRNGGLEVVTTLDLSLQEEIQRTLQTEMQDLARLRISNGAVLVTNPQTGEVLTMLGSQNYWNDAVDGQTNVTVAQRQPGSSIKPLVYAMALANGQAPWTMIDDSPFSYTDPWSGQVYAPKNYDGRFHGRVSMREALGSSYNIPAVKTLNTYSTSMMIDLAEKMGITTWGDRKRFGLSLSLGAGEVRMVDMAEAYGVFANQGQHLDLNPILEIRDVRGQVIERNACALDGVDCRGEQVLPPQVAYQITDILKDNKARTPGFGAMSVLAIPSDEVAVKTGTTNNMRDNWTIGYISDRLALVWVGNNDNTPMSYVASGVTGASPIWQQTMKLILAQETEEGVEGGHVFARPAGLEEIWICPGGGRQCGNYKCSGARREFIAADFQEMPACQTWVRPAVKEEEDWTK